MYKLLALCIAMFCISTNTLSQNISVSGILKDTTEKKPVKNAVVALLTPKDSILFMFTRTAANGSFVLKNIKPGNYIFVTTHPFYADFVDNIELKDVETKLGSVAVTSKSKLLQEVIVKSGNPIRIKGDTTIYTADSFKVSANANVEELLKKLPGIQVDKDGKIKAMGETVEKILVDGEEFFGDDPGMAVKNLRADAVKEVQVFDKKSDQAEFTGIDDGKTQKTINLKLKDDRKKGYFGKIELTEGLQNKIGNRYNNNILLNAFKGKRKIAGYLLQGNTGQDGLGWRDRQKFGGDDDNVIMSFDEEDGGMTITSSRGGSDEDPYINTEDGFFKNLNIGLQYTNKWKDKQTLNYSPKFNKLNYNNTKNTFSQFQLGNNKVFNTNANENTFVNKQNIKNNFSYDFKIDSVNSLKITSKLNIYNTKSSVYKTSENLDENNLFNNTSKTLTDNNTDKTAFSTSILFKHKFKKERRTFSVNTDFSSVKSEGIAYVNAINKLYNSGTLNKIDSIDQKKNNDNNSKKIVAHAAYTEPLSKKYSLELNYELSWTGGKNNLTTLSKNAAGNGKYEVLVDSLSNNFNQDIITNKTGFRISYKDKKVKYGFGSAVGFTKFNLKDITVNKNYLRSYANIFPAANFQYTYKANHSIGINYKGNTAQPSINQLQNLRNNTDPLNIYIGNPLLKQSFKNGVDINHNSYNFIKEIWTYQSINFSSTANAFTTSTTIDNSGKITTQPINTNGNFNASGWMGSGIKLKKLNVNLNLNASFYYSKFNDVVNNQKNNNENTNASLSAGFYKSKEKKYEFSLNNDFGFNTNKSTISNKTIKYNTNTISLNGTIYYKKTWKVSSEFANNYRQKTSDFAKNVNNSLWNARIEKTFKKDEFTVFALIRDILNQNIGIDRSIYGNTLTEERNDRLQRYWMVGIRWDFKNKMAKTK